MASPSDPTHPRSQAALTARNNRMLADWKQGLSVELIAAQYGLTRDWTRQTLSKLGVDAHLRSPNHVNKIDIDEAAAAKAYMGGATIRAIAADFGVSYGKIHKTLKSRDDVVFRAPGSPGFTSDQSRNGAR